MKIPMSKDDKKLMLVVLCLAILSTIIILLSGCQEEQRQNKWGKGDPSPEWQNWFGNDNLARLNFVQTTRINSQGQALAEVVERVRKVEEKLNSITDPNGGALSWFDKKLERYFGDANGIDIVLRRQ